MLLSCSFRFPPPTPVPWASQSHRGKPCWEPAEGTLGGSIVSHSWPFQLLIHPTGTATGRQTFSSLLLPAREVESGQSPGNSSLRPPNLLQLRQPALPRTARQEGPQAMQAVQGRGPGDKQRPFLPGVPVQTAGSLQAPRGHFHFPFSPPEQKQPGQRLLHQLMEMKQGAGVRKPDPRHGEKGSSAASCAPRPCE